MLGSGNNLRGSATISSDMSPLQQCLPLEPITLDNQKYMRPGELRRVLGCPLGSGSEDHSFLVSHAKPPAAIEELKHFKESVQDTSRKARDRVKMFREHLFKLEKYKEATSKKRQRSDLSMDERSNGANVAKMGSHMHRNHHDIMAQRLEDRAKSVGLNKRIRTSVADVRADGRSTAASRQLMVMEKGGDVLQDVGGSSVRFEEKIRRLPAGGEGWDTKNKKKRSVGVVGNRIINGDRDVKRAVHPKMSTDNKLRSCDGQGFRSKSSSGVGGVNKLDGSLEPTSSEASTVLRNEMESGPLPRDRMALLEQRIMTKGSNKQNIHEDNLASSPNTVIKAKVSRAPRTGSIMMLDSSLKVHTSSTPLQGLEQPTSSNKVPVQVANNHKRQMSAGSSSHTMAQWVGQRPHKNSRTRRANIATPVSNSVETQISSQGFPATDFSARTSSIGTNGFLVANSMDANTPKIKREPESVPSPFGFSESEESGAGENKTKDKGIDSGEVALTATQKFGAFLLPNRKNKLLSNGVGDGVQRQGRSGRNLSLTKSGVHPVREKLENIPTTKPLQSVKPASDKNKSKTGRPPSKKLKDRKASVRAGPMLNYGSLDFTGESDDDTEELFTAANSARKASNLACSGPFWKKMEPIFASIHSEDISYLKRQLNVAVELNESLSQTLGIEYNVLGVVHKEMPHYSGERQLDKSNQELVKTSFCGSVDMGRLDKGATLYQRVLSALIEEDESEEFYIHNDGKTMSVHYASDDSHCGSCNLIDIEARDRDRMESEVESKANYQNQKNCFLDRLSCNKSVSSNTYRNPSMSSSLHSNEQWPGDDDFSHSEVGHANEIFSNDLVHLQMREPNGPGFSSSERHYQLMCFDDRLLLELQSIGLCPETMPDLVEGEDMINQDIMELKEGLYQQIGIKRQKLEKIDEQVQKGKDGEKRDVEQVAMDQLVEMAYRKRLACRGNNSSKSSVRKVSRQVALAFVKRTVARCRKFEEMGSSCFADPALQDAIFSTPANNDTKSADCVGSGTASNTCNEGSNHHAEARGSGAISSTFQRYDSHSGNFDRSKKREVLIEDVIGSASSRVTSTLDSTVIGGAKGKRSESDPDRDRDQDENKGNLKSNFISGSDHKTKVKPKQKSNHLSTSASGPRGPTHSVANDSNRTNREVAIGNVPPGATKEDEPMDFGNLELDTIGDIGGPQDLDTWLNIPEDGLQELDSIGLEIPMDDLSDLQMIM